ncbi:MAG: hypothetical protein BGO78_16870 [Chloroflexi bacterium 44-23]|nr:MAG: hypothetical protein BGO78_16870 [Chloroflexi bacterium 44-23]
MPRKHLIRKSKSSNPKIPLIIVLTSFFVVIGIILLTKGQSSQDTSGSNGQAEVMLNQLIASGKPTFVFYHSTDCYTCKVMMATVAEIYPEYKDYIALVDVNVYDPANQNLLQEAQIHSIPTQVFYNKDGESTVIIGVMEPNVLRLRLEGLIDG